MRARCQVSRLHGIILTEGDDDSLNSIVYEVPNVFIRYYKFNIELIKAALVNK